ncbi:hypothetical protein CMUS01_10289 [Colletotrichum musicola]|uniref:Uncharacterized protein n=1 Tax=Colletotrichum musicola TaxID=2175873 RepID=A0A8H6N971_9PEZI|nr:hypothetical protein CMUS01_10289 [Colletotrichum musicola]
MARVWRDDNIVARELKRLHRPGSPVIVPSIWNLASLNAVLSLNTASEKPVKALATSAPAMAAALGLEIEELEEDHILEALERISEAVVASGLPLVVDVRDGYGDQLGYLVSDSMVHGAVGVEIGDSALGVLLDAERQTFRIRAAIKGGQGSNREIPDFVVNARMYLEFGATTVTYASGPGRGLRREEIEVLVRELGGRVGVRLKDGEDALTTRELAEIGVARIDVGDSVYQIAMNAAKKATARILGGRRLKA